MGKSETVDLGRMFEICLCTDGLHKTGPRLRIKPKYTFVHPDLVSYLIKHTHSISWEISFSVAGETQRVRSQAPLKVLAAD